MREREEEKYEKEMEKEAYNNGSLSLHEYTTVPDMWLTWPCSVPSHHMIHMPLDRELEPVRMSSVAETHCCGPLLLCHHSFLHLHVWYVHA